MSDAVPGRDEVPYFFLSYSRGDGDRHLDRFF
jgi:hypothetical protein